jgi:CDP-diacylglycerol--glycerol-3-phosphate 3-phosphatidyltransferase
MKIKVPILLIYLRLLLGFIVLASSIVHITHYAIIAIILLTLGLLTDIFDGIIARQLNISTQKLRRLDSSVDQVFFICIAIATYIQCPDFFHTNSTKLIILFSVEALAYLVCFIKFKKEIATHTIGAKLWTLLLFSTLIEVIFHCESKVLFELCFWMGIITRLEIIGIMLTLKNWTNDVPTLIHAVKLRQGKEIKKHKLFNG